jgi:hypothetical protein
MVGGLPHFFLFGFNSMVDVASRKVGSHWAAKKKKSFGLCCRGLVFGLSTIPHQELSRFPFFFFPLIAIEAGSCESAKFFFAVDVFLRQRIC